ncbi:MAG: hypothetical protein JKY65_10190 [Planctomycetes bacterium]|nr:hypothetical protein [Planctomycetota bacterium]
MTYLRLFLVLAAVSSFGCATAQITAAEVASDTNGVYVLTEDQDFAHVPDRCVVSATYGAWESSAVPVIVRGTVPTRTLLTNWMESSDSDNGGVEEVLRVRFHYSGAVVTERDFGGLGFDPSGSGRTHRTQVSNEFAPSASAGGASGEGATRPYCPTCGGRWSCSTESACTR